LQESEQELLNNLEITISPKIIGQKAAITALCQAVRRGRLKLAHLERPVGVFLMLGPSGVGKTESAKVLSHTLFGSVDNFLRLDMSEYQDSSDVTKLIGAPPGYIGHGKGGKLTNWLKNKPLSIVLFDEIEKANESIYDLLLGLFDAGHITDGNGETVRCPDVIFIMTSNLGAQQILEHDHQGKSEEEIAQTLDALLATKFRKEFIGRIQETVIYHPLSEEEIHQIATRQCTELKVRIAANPQCSNLEMSWDKTLIQFLAKTYYNRERGARGIANGITRTMENRIADGIIRQEIKPGHHLHFTSDGKLVKLEIRQSTSSNSSNGH
jgi:ATP-dependent Clp protease ATP-binding subunit ClpA